VRNLFKLFLKLKKWWLIVQPFFADPKAPIIAQTDASDYGIGIYVFQVINGQERPIAIASHSLSTEQSHWSVIEKELYAIYYFLHKFDYLFKNNRFTLQTDHKNLVYLNTEGSAKVRRWKMALLEFDFDVEYIKGPMNVVADTLSRLCDVRNPELLCTLPDFRIPAEKFKLIHSVHNVQTGHHGVERTLAKLVTLNHQWQYMREHVKRFVKCCPFCQKMSYLKVPIHTHPFTTSVYEPMECLNIDTIGPLPVDEYGCSYILVVIDCFTRFIELYPLSDVSAAQAARMLLQHIGRYGAPSSIRSDRGSQFVNEIIQQLLELIGVEHCLTTAYSKEENSIVERANREVLRHLNALIFHTKVYNQWSSAFLPLVQRIFNAEIRKSLSTSPAQLLFGNAITLDRGIFLPPSLRSPVKLSDNMSKMLSMQDTLLKVAAQTQRATDDHNIQERTPSHVTEFPVNSYVLMAYPNRPPTKFTTPWQGPLRVVKYDGSIYTVQNLLTQSNKDVHISMLKPFHFDSEYTTPFDVAMQDQQEFLIDRILSHRGNKHKRKSLEFLVRWAGYDESADSWEPWDNVKATTQLHKYLQENKMKALIPKSLRL